MTSIHKLFYSHNVQMTAKILQNIDKNRLSEQEKPVFGTVLVLLVCVQNHSN